MADGFWHRIEADGSTHEPHVQTGFAFPYIVTSANDDEEAAMLALEYLARPAIAQQVAIRYQPTTNTAVSNDPDYLAAKPRAQDIAHLSGNLYHLPTYPTRATQIYNVLQELRDQ